MNRRQFLASAAVTSVAAPALIRSAGAQQESPFRVKYYPVQPGMGSRDVTPAPDGTIWFNGQRNGTLGRLDPRDGSYKLIELGKGAAPHGVIIGPDGAPWITEGGQNAIARVDPADHKVRLFKLPESTGYANLNTAVFDKSGIYWFTGQSGIYGRLDPKSGDMQIFQAPRGRGAYGMTLTPKGDVWYASLAGSHIAKIDLATGNATVVEPPTPNQGARRIWSDSKNRLWVSEWNSGNVSMHDPADGSWKAWKLPGEKPRTYSVYVDEKDNVWLTDFTANAIVRFDPLTEKFTSFPSDMPGANVRQMDGRPGEAWGGESGTNRLVVIQTVAPA
jgi:virginiamycin B lyase